MIVVDPISSRELDHAALHVTYIPVVELQDEEIHNRMTAPGIDSFSPVWELSWFKRTVHYIMH